MQRFTAPQHTEVSSPSDSVASDPFAAWCRRLVASDSRALEELFHHTHDALVTYASSLTQDRAMARDIVQEAYVKLWEGRDRLDAGRSLRSLLYLMVRNRALNAIRDDRKRNHLIAEHYAPPEPAMPDHELDGNQLRERLNHWMRALPERQREALTLSRFEGLSHDEIATVMDISPRTVNNHLVKALRHLRERINDYAPHLLHELS